QSGGIYTGVLITHWRAFRKKGHWLCEGSGKRWSDFRDRVAMHAHSIDAAQEGFYKGCTTTRALRRDGIAEARFPHHRKRFRTTIWKNTAIKRKGDVLVLSNDKGNRPIEIALPESLHNVLRFREVRLVSDQRAGRHVWHVVVEDGQQPKPAP